MSKEQCSRIPCEGYPQRCDHCVEMTCCENKLSTRKAVLTEKDARPEPGELAKNVSNANAHIDYLIDDDVRERIGTDGRELHMKVLRLCGEYNDLTARLKTSEERLDKYGRCRPSCESWHTGPGTPCECTCGFEGGDNV